RPLLDRYRSVFRIWPAALQRGEGMFARYGAGAIFFARFVFGMRVFAGPLAGVLRMRWRAFAIFNFLGAAVWVVCIASAGYFFGQHWRSLVRVLQRFNVVVLIVFVAVTLFLWWRYRRQAPPGND
ncbi:MAG: VTT domain-containing protein, partial [Terriglobales bacterium]